MPSCDLFTSLALLSSFWRETSLVNITGPRSIFTPLFTPSIYFQFLFSVALLSLSLILCKQQAGEIDNSSVLVGSKVICFCVQVTTTAQFLAPLSPSCISASPTRDKPWYLHRGKFAATVHLTFHLGKPTRSERTILTVSPPSLFLFSFSIFS